VRQAERWSAILELLSENGTLAISDVSRELGVSAATIRRDFQKLEIQRLLARTHGGAVAHGVLYELPLRYRGGQYQDEKRRIAAVAAKRLPERAAVGLTGGTTTTEVARALVGRQGLTVVTTALNIAWELAVRPNLKVVVAGGVLRPESYELAGPLAEMTLISINLDVVFVGVDGISEEAGLTTHHEVEAHTNRLLIERARRVIVVADNSKIGRITFARICELNHVHELITDAAADAAPLKGFRDAGIRITTV
jgi:DeoR family transcriptional regulator, aga operon transcriptional repressor